MADEAWKLRFADKQIGGNQGATSHSLVAVDAHHGAIDHDGASTVALDRRLVWVTQDTRPAAHDLLMADEWPPTGVHAENFALPAPKVLHRFEITLCEGKVKGVVCKQCFVRVHGVGLGAMMSGDLGICSRSTKPMRHRAQVIINARGVFNLRVCCSRVLACAPECSEAA